MTREATRGGSPARRRPFDVQGEGQSLLTAGRARKSGTCGMEEGSGPRLVFAGLGVEEEDERAAAAADRTCRTRLGHVGRLVSPASSRARRERWRELMKTFECADRLHLESPKYDRLSITLVFFMASWVSVTGDLFNSSHSP